VNHVLAMLLVVLDCITRVWRIQLATWAAGGTLSFTDALRLNLYGEAAATLTPNRLGGEPARFLGMTWSGMRPVTALVALGVEVAAEWPTFGLIVIALGIHYLPDWSDRAGRWLSHSLARDPPHDRDRDPGRVACGLRVTAAGARRRDPAPRTTAMARRDRARAARPLVGRGCRRVADVRKPGVPRPDPPALAWGMAGAPPFSEMFFGALALLQAGLLVPLPSGGGGIEVAFLSGFAGEFPVGQSVILLLLWRFYTAVLLTILGVYLLVRTHGAEAAKELFTIGWFKRRS